MKRTLIVALLLVAAACVDNRSLIEIDGRAAPSDLATCKFKPGGDFIMGAGVLDVGLAMQPTYRLVVYVKNNLVDPEAISPDAQTAAKAWTANAAKVRVNPSGYVGKFSPNPPLLGVSPENVLPLDGQTIQPGGGASTQLVEAISGPLGAQLAGQVPPGELRQVVLGISLQGRTLDGSFLESNEWYFPLELCNGCLAAPAACPAGQTLTAGSCFDGQDAAPFCK